MGRNGACAMTDDDRTARESASLKELLDITGPSLGYEIMIAGLFKHLEEPEASPMAIDLEGRRNQAVFQLRLRAWLKREAIEKEHPAAAVAMLEILDRRGREHEEG